MPMQTIVPFLWFHEGAEEAMHFYTSIFTDSKVISVMPGAEGKAMGVDLEIRGLRLRIINGGPQFTINEGISFMVDCQDQTEVDYLWEKLGDGGTYQACGWLKDKYGVSWQIVPKVLGELLGGADREKANKAMQAMLKMQKIDVQGLLDAVA
jgi:predicted 3-demethylubiquinone-9 3-methyltransferase (glyoxalase superfamily)